MKKYTDWLNELAQITLGITIVAFGLNLFLIPNKLAAGGVSGLATVLFHIYNIPVGPVIALLNVILFVVGTSIFGKPYGVKTVYGAFGLALAIQLTSTLNPVTGDSFLATLYGGVLSGLGMGIVFRNGANTGGTDILAQILKRYSNFPLGQLFLIIDASVTLLAWSAFGAKLALYGLIAVFIMSRVIDLVLEGLTVEKAAFIISDKHNEIIKGIIEQLDRGATLIDAKGAFSGKERPTILCVVTRKELEPLRELVHSIDPEAFTIITDAREVTGEGFKLY